VGKEEEGGVRVKKLEAPLIKKHEMEMREIEKGVELSWEDAEKRLREWDMNSHFGPCMSVTQLARCERAKKLEMDPPEFIHNVLKACEVSLQLAHCIHLPR